MNEIVLQKQVLLKAAQAYQKLNWRTVPIEAGNERKPPVLYKHLTTIDPQDTEFITNFKEHTECPAIAKIVDPDEIVIDIDGGEWLEMPVTPTVITPRGAHYHFKRPAGLQMPNAAINCGDGFEVKAGGMLSNIPPGLHSSGVPYEWKYGPETPMAELPQWCIDKINDYYTKTRTKKGKMSKKELTRLSNGVEGGERNNAMMRYGGHLIGKGFEWPKIERELQEWNQKNKPPLNSKEFKNNLRSLKKMHHDHENKKSYNNLKKEQNQCSSDICNSTNEEAFTAAACGDMVQQNLPMFVLRDTLEFYIYRKGIYKNIGSRKTALPVRALIRKLFREKAIKFKGADPDNEFIGSVLTYLEDTFFIERADLQVPSTDLICLENGIYDRKQRVLLPHNPEYKLLAKIPVNYNPNAKCPTIKKFISEIVNPECITTIYEFFGYCLIPDTTIQKALLLVGEGANGKTVLIKLLDKFIGTDNRSKESLQALETDPYSVAELFGRLVNTCADLSSKGLYENSMIKQLIGDEGSIRARKIYCPPFSFKNTAKLVFSVNIAPPVPDDPAYFRRWIIITFPNKFEGKNADKNLSAKLQTDEELSGLLNIALEFLDQLMERGEYSYSPSTEDIQKLYKIKSDPIAAFTQECLVYSEEDTNKTVVFAHYCKWCNDKGIKMRHENEFSKRLKKLGFEASRPRTEDGSREHVWQNVAIKPPTWSGVQNQSPDQKNQEAEPSWSGGQGSKSHCCLGNLSSPSGQVEGEKEESMCQEYNNREIAMTALTKLEQSIESSPDQVLTTNPDQNLEKPVVFEEKAGDIHQFTPEKYPIIVVPIGQGEEIVQQQLILLETQ